jgi:hypothetical protein
MKISLQHHIDNGEKDADGNYDFYYEFDVFSFSEGSFSLYARSYIEDSALVSFTNSTRDEKVIFLTAADFKKPFFIEACTYLHAIGKQQFQYLDKKQGYVAVDGLAFAFAPLFLMELGAFYTEVDEAAFFDWLKAIEGVVGVEEKPYGVLVHLKTMPISDASLRDFIALHHRYRLPMQRLRLFKHDENAHWFCDKNADWYENVFTD